MTLIARRPAGRQRSVAWRQPQPPGRALAFVMAAVCSVYREVRLFSSLFSLGRYRYLRSGSRSAAVVASLPRPLLSSKGTPFSQRGFP